MISPLQCTCLAQRCLPPDNGNKKPSERMHNLTYFLHCRFVCTAMFMAWGRVQVFKAVDRLSGQEVAMKRIFLRQPEQGIPSNVFREYKALQLLNDEHIVELLDVFAMVRTAPLLCACPFQPHTASSRACKSVYRGHILSPSWSCVVRTCTVCCTTTTFRCCLLSSRGCSRTYSRVCMPCTHTVRSQTYTEYADTVSETCVFFATIPGAGVLPVVDVAGEDTR